MPLHQGYLLIADISGYTAYLTSTELDHANPILRSLLEAIVTEVGEPLHLWRMEGDAVLAYSREHGFPSGDAFLAICENLYRAFIARRTDIRANTTCTCKACANIESLDLKILAHYGEFEEMKVGPMTDISGPDVILVHRMSKTDVKEKTGIGSYALFSQAAVDAMNLGDVPMLEYSTSFDHFGEVPMRVYDLAKAWETYRESTERSYIGDDDAVYIYRHLTAAPVGVAWEYLVAPELKRIWMGMRDVSLNHEGPRMGTGSKYHCIHDDMEFHYWITDWRPFQYFSTRILDPMHPGLFNRETYEVREGEEGTEIIYRMGPLVDDAGTHHPDAQREVIAFLASFWPRGFGAMEDLVGGGNGLAGERRGSPP